ncbi:MAG: hypothetical protein RJB62_162 [Pseudomonadota bacterium]|jgi:hypothetical protein
MKPRRRSSPRREATLSTITRRNIERAAAVLSIVLLGAVLLVVYTRDGADRVTASPTVGMTGFSEADELKAITVLMLATWDTPNAPLAAGPIAVVDGYAVADWTQGDMGGRALLRKRDGDWAVILCAGDILTTADGLVRVGVPAETGRALARELKALERSVMPQRLEAMSRFLEIVPMDETAPEHAQKEL